MNENEAKQVLENVWDFATPEDDEFGDIVENAIYVVNNVLEEIQQYRAIGLTPELIEAMQGHNVALINDLGEYQSIGTVEECRAAVEKQVAKKPKYKKIKYGKHKWKRNESGEIDNWAWEFAYCNGVVCEVCGDSYCVHCDPDYDKNEDCEVEYYNCPLCGEKVGFRHTHCKCGQKLDWEGGAV